MFALVGVGVLLAGHVEAATFNGARNGTSVLGGYVELGGTLRRDTSIMQGSNYKLGIGTRTPLNMLHLNSGTCNVAMRVQSTDPYALITFQDNLVSNPSTPPYVGGTGDSIVMGINTTDWAKVSGNTVYQDSLGVIEVDEVAAYDVFTYYVDATAGVWVYGGDVMLDPDSVATNVYMNLDTVSAVPVDGCNPGSTPADLGRMIYDSTANVIWVCAPLGWASTAALTYPQ